MALSAERQTRSRNELTPISVPVAAGYYIFGGSMVALDVDGNAIPCDPEDETIGTIGVVGVATARADNSAGSAGAISVQLRQGEFHFTASLDQTAFGTTVYGYDDDTLEGVRDDAGTTPQVAGVVTGIDDDGAWVSISVGASRALSSAVSAGLTTDTITVPAGEDLTGAQYYIVKLKADGGGDPTVIKPENPADDDGIRVLGVLQNAPDLGADAIVKVWGLSTVRGGAGIDLEVGDLITAGGQTSGSFGRAIVATAGNYVLGQIVTPTAQQGGLATMVITHEGVLPE